MKLEIGQVYRTRDNRIAKVVEFDSKDNVFAAIIENNSSHLWYEENGLLCRINLGEKFKQDLVFLLNKEDYPEYYL